ncbi:MAG: GNAT family N-acetyltransferase, partial [Kiritimatiellae bacterium]|nr:GNAT family N-acetyltransferase [Kiritimatiellia bacterium]
CSIAVQEERKYPMTSLTSRSGTAFKLNFEPFPRPNGPLSCAYVPWDSELFGFPFYELKCADADPELLSRHLGGGLDSLSRDHACLVLARLPPEHTRITGILARYGFYPVETMLDFDLVLARLNIILKHDHEQYGFRRATPDDLPAVGDIACGAFAADRFHMDPNIPSDKADQRYACWVENSFRTQDQVFVLEETNPSRIIGFIQCRDLAPRVVDVCLGAVRRDIQKSGAGVQMYQQLFLDYRARGYQKAVTHVSINNLSGVKLTLRYGFTISNAMLCMHWFRPAGMTAKQ